MKHMAEIRNDNGISTLYVDGQPFQAFAGEVHNSAAYDPERMEIEIWEKMEQSNLNTLIVPVYWETLEPAFKIALMVVKYMKYMETLDY